MTLQERLIESRKLANLKQKELAERAGFAAAAISQYESGVRNPSSKALLALSKALQVSPDYLMYGYEADELVLRPEDREAFELFKSLSPMDRELLNLFKHLAPKEKEATLDYLRYLAKKNSKAAWKQEAEV